MKLVRYGTDQGVYCALVEEGRKKISVCTIGYGTGVTLKKVPLSEARYMEDYDYPVKKAVRKFRQAGASLGITKGARAFLKRPVA